MSARYKPKDVGPQGFSFALLDTCARYIGFDELDPVASAGHEMEIPAETVAA